MTDADGWNGNDSSDSPSGLFQSLNLNSITIEDIEEIIKKDKVDNSTASNNCCVDITAGQAPVPLLSMEGVASSSQRVQPYTKIVIQPAQKALRFRYECEGRSAGSIPGANSSAENKTYPTIQVINYVGRAVVVVSCVTKDEPYRPHPHKLVGKEGCKKGICTVSLNNENMICSFSNLGIQCVKRKDIEDALREREEDRVDPFNTSFAHKNQAGNIDLNSVRLCFQVFIEDKQKRTFTIPLAPVVSDPIFDKKAMCDLVICKLSACSASVLGQVEIIILCEKIVRDDIQVRFYEEKDRRIVWEGYGDFQPSDVHKQVAISLKTPRYHTIDLQQAIDVCIQLRRPSDGTISEPRPFQFLPVESDHDAVNSKRRKVANASLDLYLAENTDPRRDLRNANQMMATRPIRHPHKTKIKTEPVDRGYACGGASPYSMQASPLGHPMHQGEASGHHAMPQPNPFYRMQMGSPMATAPSSVAGFNPVLDFTMNQMSPHGYQPSSHSHMASPEVINIPSHSSGGSVSMVYNSNPETDPQQQQQQQQQQVLSSGSTHLSLGLGSLDSLPLSEVTLSIIGSHLSDTFLCLNPENLSGQLGDSGDFAARIAGGREDIGARSRPQEQRQPVPEQAQRMSSTGSMNMRMGEDDGQRHTSSDSFNNMLHITNDQIMELNELGWQKSNSQDF